MIINYKVTKSNILILNKSCLSLNSHRWLNIVYSKIDPRLKKLKNFYIISFQDFTCFYPFIKVSSIKSYAFSFKKEIINMQYIYIYKNKIGYKKIKFIETVNYEKGNLYISFFKNMKNYLINQQEKFTSYFVKNIINFKSQYSFRVYEIAIMYLNQGLRKKKLNINLFKEQIGMNKNKYSRFNNLKEKLKYNINEINKYSNINIDLSYDRKKYNSNISCLNMLISLKKESNIIKFSPLSGRLKKLSHE